MIAGAVGAQSGAAFRKWWPGFQAAVAKHDAKAVSRGRALSTAVGKWPRCPRDQEQSRLNGAIRCLLGAGDQEADRDQAAGATAERQLYDRVARAGQYSLHFTPTGDGFTLDGLGEGSP